MMDFRAGPASCDDTFDGPLPARPGSLCCRLSGNLFVRCVLLCCVLLCSLLLVGSTSTANGSTPLTGSSRQQPAAKAVSQEPLLIQIEQIEPSSSSGGRGDRAADLLLRLSLRVQIRNISAAPIVVRSTDFILTSNGLPVPRGTFSSGPELKETELLPDEQVAGWLWFAEIDGLVGEPILALTWEGDDESTLVSVNSEIRRLTAAAVSLRGPDQCLAVISVDRPLDVLTSWALQDQLQELGRRGLQRLVIQSRSNTPAPVSEQVLAWLATWKQVGIPNAEQDNSQGNGQFLEIHLGRFERSPGRRMPGTSDLVPVHRDDDDAVLAALRTVYQRIPVDEMFRDVLHEDAGVRRAAIAGCGDRLRPEQIQEYLELLSQAAPERQSELLEPMHLMMHADVLASLHQLSLSEDSAVSSRALHALTRNDDPAAAEMVQRLWQTSADRTELRQRLVDAALKSRDYRWCSLLAAYVQELLYYQAGRTPATTESPLQGATEHRDSGTQAASLREVLPFLRQHRHDAALDTCRSVLLQIRDPAVQDVVVDFLQQWRLDRDAELIRQYLAQRMADDQITETVRNTAFQYPHPQWTAYLLRDFQQARNQSVSQRKSLSAALRSASVRQLEEFLEHFSELDLQSQGTILTHLAAVEYPGWRMVAGEALRQHSVRLREAMETLQQDGSDESIGILNSHLLELLNSDVDWKAASAVEMIRTRIQPLISQISLFAHPESQRVLNRCLRHPDEQVRRHARQSMAAALRRSPGLPGLLEVQELKKARKYEEALARCDDVIRMDSFLSEAYLYRASLLLRQDRLQEAMQDLRLADALCPEELSTLSTIALVMVRQGDLPGGLRLADSTLQLDPEEESTLYNTACVYGRAAENTSLSADEQQHYLEESLRLLRSSVAAGFSDADHLQQDPDLACLHQHSAWPEILQQIAENQERQKRDLPDP